jgi:hypothetical protein
MEYQIEDAALTGDPWSTLVIGISLYSLAIYKPTPLPATPTPLYIYNLIFHTNASILN